MWDTREGREIHTLRGHTEFVRGIASSADGYLLASCGGDKTIRFWDFQWTAAYKAFLPQVRQAVTTLQTISDDPAALGVLGAWYSFRGVDKWAVKQLASARAGNVKVSEIDLARSHWRLGQMSDASAAFNAALTGSRDANESLYLSLCLRAVSAATAKSIGE
jgi:WD40 repeat protein